MGSTFSTLEIGKRGLAAHQRALQTTGHNISNADNKDYARRRVVLDTADPIYSASLNRANVAGQIGQGSVVSAIERIRDHFLDDRMIETSSLKGFWKTKDQYLNRLEIVYSEPVGTSIRTMMDDFWQSFEELANFPENFAHREVVKEKAIGLQNRVQDTFRKLFQIKSQSNEELISKANLLNVKSENIRTLNERIAKLEALGDNPNDLYDKRDKLIEDLSSMADISTGRNDENEFMVFIEQQILVQGEKANKILLQPNANKEGMTDLYWESTGNEVKFVKGEIQSLFDIRDRVLTRHMSNLDALALNVMDSINEIHQDGFGINATTNQDFFDIKRLSNNASGGFDEDGDGVNELTTIFRITGKQTLEGNNPIGINGVLTFHTPDNNETEIKVGYSEKDTVNEVIKRINDSKTGVVAYLNHDKQLSIKATTSLDEPKRDFMIRHLEDSGEFLVGFSGILSASGIAGSFNYNRANEINKLQANDQDISFTPYYHISSNFKVSENIVNNVANIAAARGKDIGGTGDYNTANGQKDGSNALLIAAALKNNPVMVDYSENFSDFYTAVISELGTARREAKLEFEIQEDVAAELDNLRQSVMGVNLDEEMSNMVQFQHSYNASARMITTFNQMLDIIINRLVS